MQEIIQGDINGQHANQVINTFTTKSKWVQCTVLFENSKSVKVF